MLDLIYVNVIIVLFDVLVVILLYLNRVGISHPIQTFSYALKLKLEFAVLNQLMAVAARGLQKESFEERRYHHSSAHDAFSAECRQWEEKESTDPQQEPSDSDHNALRKSPSVESDQLTVPVPVLSKSSQPLRRSTTDGELDSHGNIDKDVFMAKQKRRPENFYDDDSASSQAEEIQAFPSETLRSCEGSTTGNPGWHTYPQHLRDAKNKALRSTRYPIGQNVSQGGGGRRQAIRTTIGRRIPTRNRNGGEEYEEEEEEEIGVHMWENNGKLKIETPWFRSNVEV